MRFWNTLTQQPLQCIDTGSQVCNLAWSKHSSELVSTHGYSQNQILLWKYPSLTQVAKLTGHSYRVLYLVSLTCIANIWLGYVWQSISYRTYFIFCPFPWIWINVDLMQSRLVIKAAWGTGILLLDIYTFSSVEVSILKLLVSPGDRSNNPQKKHSRAIIHCPEFVHLKAV